MARALMGRQAGLIERVCESEISEYISEKRRGLPNLIFFMGLNLNQPVSVSYTHLTLPTICSV